MIPGLGLQGLRALGCQGCIGGVYWVSGLGDYRGSGCKRLGFGIKLCGMCPRIPLRKAEARPLTGEDPESFMKTLEGTCRF